MNRAALLRRRSEITATMRSLRDRISAGDATATPDAVDALIAERDGIDRQLDLLDRSGGPAQPGVRPNYDTQARIGREAGTYRRDHHSAGTPSFLADLYGAQVLRDPAAAARLQRHGEEVLTDRPDFAERAVGSGAVAGFVPPAYLVELWAELARAGRPVADACARLPLPPTGMSITVPRVTTGTAVGVQASENTALTNQDADDTLLTVPVVTIGGYVDVSRQAVQRGVLVEQVLFADLGADYNAKLDAQVIAANGTSGQHTGLLSAAGVTITYTDASPTVPELWPKLADAVRQVVSQRFTGPTHLIMHPLTWGWLLAERDTAGRPLIDTTGTGSNAGGTAAAPAYAGIAGRLLGVPVIVSGNVPTNLGAGTNETRIIAADLRDVPLLEDPSGAPMQLAFEEPLASSLGIRLVAYGFSALAAGRQPKAIAVISGTGLILPAL